MLHGDPASDGMHPGLFDPTLLAVLASDPDMFREAFEGDEIIKETCFT